MSAEAGDGGGGSLTSVQDEIVAEMSELQDHLEKYEYLVALGRALEVWDGALRQDEYAVPGCQSQVWIRAEVRAGRLRIRADSDALITRGIIALLLRVLDDRTPGEILGTDLFFLDRTGLRTHLSPARANGLAAMVRQIEGYAEEAVEGR